jgi:hypothetical protein
MDINVTNGSNRLTFDSLTLGSVDMSGAPLNITISNSPVLGCSEIQTPSMNNSNIVFDGITMANVATCPKEGRITVYCSECSGPGGANPAGVTIKNSTFGALTGTTGCTDGIQTGSNGVTIGPNNRFLRILQGSCSAHVDGIQSFAARNTTIFGNYFQGNTVAFGFYDGGVDGPNVTIHDNVVADSEVCDFGTVSNMLFYHNTMRTSGCRVGGINQAGGGSGTYRDNIMGSTFNDPNFYPTGSHCTTCTYTHNLFTGASEGTGNTLGTPTYMGGANPATWQGYQLTAGSLGHNGATDGLDFGVTTYGP